MTGKFYFSSTLKFIVKTYFQSLKRLTLQTVHWSPETLPLISQDPQYFILFCFKMSKLLTIFPRNYVTKIPTPPSHDSNS